MDQHIAITNSTAIASSDALHAETRAYLDAAVATNTRRAHRSHWQHFIAFCATHAVPALPAAPETVAAYLTLFATTHAVGTLEHRLATITKAHATAGLPNPAASELIRTQMRGIRRTHGVAPNQKTPALVADLQLMLATLPDTLLGCRDRALLLLGFATAARRSELVALDVADLAFTSDGLVVSVRRSKTDQTGVGVQKGVHFGRHAETCPVRTLRGWLDAAAITAGPVFRTVDRHGNVSEARLGDRAVALVIKRAAAAAGLDPGGFAGHSLRAGLATQAAMNGEGERAIMRQTGHRSVTMVRRYIRQGSLFTENVTGRIGL